MTEQDQMAIVKKHTASAGRGEVRIVLDEGEVATDPTSRLNNHYEFFQTLHELGRRAAQRFLAEHFDAIGSRSTMDATVEAEREYASG